MTEQSPYAPAAPPASAAPAAPLPAHHLGQLSLALGGSALLLGIVFTVLQGVMIGTGQYQLITVIGGFRSVLQGALAIAAIVVGLLALNRPGNARTLAAAGAAVGGTLLIVTLSDYLYSAMIMLTSF